MHDIRAIRENPAGFDAAISRVGAGAVSGDILALDEARRAKILAAETAQAEQNKASKEVGAAKGRGDEAEFERLRALVAEKKAEVARLNDEAKAEDAKLTDLRMGLPNLYGFRDRRETLWRALCRAVGRCRPSAPRVGAIHDRHPYG